MGEAFEVALYHVSIAPRVTETGVFRPSGYRRIGRLIPLIQYVQIDQIVPEAYTARPNNLGRYLGYAS